MFTPKPGDQVRYCVGGSWHRVACVWSAGPNQHIAEKLGGVTNASIVQLRPAEETLMELRKWFRARDGWRFLKTAQGVYVECRIRPQSSTSKWWEDASARTERLALLRLKRKVEGK